MSDSETDYYSYDTDAEYDKRIQSINEEGSEEVLISAVSANNIFPVTSCASLRFRLLDGVSEDGVVAYVPKSDVNSSSTYFSISTPMKRTGELEVQLEGSGGTDLSLLEISLNRRKSRNYHTDYRYRVCTLTQGAVLNYLKQPPSIQESHHIFLLHDRVGIKITRNGAVEMFANGKSQGIVAEAVYKLGHNISYYPVMHVPPGLVLTLTAGGKSLLIITYTS